MNELTVTKLRDGVWNFNEQAPGTAVDAYLVVGTERAVMIDALQGATGVYAKARELTDLPMDLLLTHGHFDHAGVSTQEFAEAGCMVYMAMADYPVLTAFGGSALPEEAFTDLKDGQAFDLGGCVLETILVPGHTPGSAVFLDRAAGIAYSGDSFGSGPIWLQLPGCLPLSQYQEKLESVLAKLETVPELLLLTGHRNQSPEPLHLDYVHDLLDTVKAVRDGSLRGETQQMEMGGSAIPFAVVSHGKMLGLFYSPEHIED